MVFDIYSPQHNLVQIIEIKVQSIDSVRKETIIINSLAFYLALHASKVQVKVILCKESLQPTHLLLLAL
jgi:hypothetical protein